MTWKGWIYMEKFVHVSNVELEKLLNEGELMLIDCLEVPDGSKVLLLKVEDKYALVIQKGVYPDCKYTPV